jgi:hypothetical protein
MMKKLLQFMLLTHMICNKLSSKSNKDIAYVSEMAKLFA